MGEEKKHTIQTVDRLPKVAILDKLIFNKRDGFFYLGVDAGKGEDNDGDHLEETSV